MQHIIAVSRLWLLIARFLGTPFQTNPFRSLDTVSRFCYSVETTSHVTIPVMQSAGGYIKIPMYYTINNSVCFLNTSSKSQLMFKLICKWRTMFSTNARPVDSSQRLGSIHILRRSPTPESALLKRDLHYVSISVCAKLSHINRYPTLSLFASSDVI